MPMSVELTLYQTKASGPLMPTSIAIVLDRLGTITRGRSPRAAMRGGHLRVALDLSLDDAACAAVPLEFAGQGQRLRGMARGPSAVLLHWTFHTIAAALKCTLQEPPRDAGIGPDAGAFHDAALAYLEAYERAVNADRERHGQTVDPEDAAGGGDFLEWLAGEEHIALRTDEQATGARASLSASLPMRDVGALYEALLDSDAVDDVFMSETELVSLLDRFRARTIARR